MEGRLVLKDCSLFRTDGRVRGHMAVVIEGRTITRVAPDEEVVPLPGDWIAPCRGRIVTPGLVDCHTRLVNGALAPFSAERLLSSPDHRFREDGRLASALTPGEVAAITAWGLARGLRSGVTLSFEHLRAPNAAFDCLVAQGNVARTLGARLVSAHASSSRDRTPGPAQVDANARYVATVREDPLLRGSIGVGPSAAAENDLLREAGRVKEEVACGAHLNVAESDEDILRTWEAHACRIVHRFERFGLLGGGCIAAHGRSLDRSDAERLARTRTLVAISPRAGHLSGARTATEVVLTSDNVVGLGTDGVCSLWEELTTCFSGVLALARAARTVDTDAIMSSYLIGGPAELCTMLFGLPSGAVAPGALADVVVFDHVPVVDSAEALPATIMELARTQAAWTIVDGRVVVREGQLVAGDAISLAQESALAIAAVQRRVLGV